jgi:hypothetical protein
MFFSEKCVVLQNNVEKMGEPERPMVTTIKHGAEEMRLAFLITSARTQAHAFSV